MLSLIKQVALFIVVLLSYLDMFGQTGDTLQIERTENNVVKFLRFKPNSNANRRLENAKEFLYTIHGIKGTYEFTETQSNTDELNITHKTFQQYFQGIRVDGGVYLVHGNSQEIESINGDFIPVDLKSISPALTVDVAREKAIDYIDARKYKWQDSSLQKFKRQIAKEDHNGYFPSGELVICKDMFISQGKWKLAYKFTISALEPESENLVYIDALSGEILNKVSLLCSTNAPGSAQTRYSGTRNMTGDSFVGGFRLREVRKSE